VNDQHGIILGRFSSEKLSMW